MIINWSSFRPIFSVVCIYGDLQKTRTQKWFSFGGGKTEWWLRIKRWLFCEIVLDIFFHQTSDTFEICSHALFVVSNGTDWGHRFLKVLKWPILMLTHVFPRAICLKSQWLFPSRGICLFRYVTEFRTIIIFVCTKVKFFISPGILLADVLVIKTTNNNYVSVYICPVVSTNKRMQF